MASPIKRRVWIGVIFGCAAVGSWMFWTRRDLPVPSTAVPPSPPKPFVVLAGAGSSASDELLREKADLLDPTPLFFPTDRNYGQRPLPPGSFRQPGEAFASFGPVLNVVLNVDDQNLAPYRTETTPVPEKLSDVLTQGNEAPFAGMGQIDLQPATLPIRSGYLEVSDLRNGDIIISQALSGLEVPRQDYTPAEFIVVIGPAGVVGDPFLTSGSGGEETDNFFRAYLVKSYRLGERLRPGRYRVLVGA